MNTETNYIELFLRAMMEYSSFYRVFNDNWKPIFFENKIQPLIYASIVNSKNANGVFPKRKDLIFEYGVNDKYRKFKLEEVTRIIDFIYDIKIVDYTETYIKGVFLEKVKRFKLQRTIQSIINKIDSKDKIDVSEARDEILNSLKIKDGGEDDTLDYFEYDVLDRMRILSDADKSHFRTGISDDIDDILKLKRKTVVALSAELGVGKSLFLNNVASNAAVDGFNCLYLSLEMDKFDISKRIDKIIHGFSINDYYDDPALCAGKMSELKSNKKLGKLLIKAFPPRSLSSLQIKDMLEGYRLNNTPIDIILVDYLTLMRPNEMFNGMKSYDKGKAIAEELQIVAKEDNCLILTALQVNRNAYGKDSQGSELVAESIAIPMQLDSLINMREYISDNDEKFFIVSSEKVRDNKKTKSKIYWKLEDNLKIVPAKEEDVLLIQSSNTVVGNGVRNPKISKTGYGPNTIDFNIGGG